MVPYDGSPPQLSSLFPQEMVLYGGTPPLPSSLYPQEKVSYDGSPPPPSSLYLLEMVVYGVRDVGVAIGDHHFGTYPFYGLSYGCRGEEGDVKAHFGMTVVEFWAVLVSKRCFLLCLFWV